MLASLGLGKKKKAKGKKGADPGAKPTKSSGATKVAKTTAPVV